MLKHAEEVLSCEGVTERTREAAEALIAKVRSLPRATAIGSCLAELRALSESCAADSVVTATQRLSATKPRGCPSSDEAAAAKNAALSPRKRAEAVLLGLASGDSLGSMSEFRIPWEVGELCSDLWPATLQASTHWSAGEPTDDTDMALCVARAVAVGRGFDAAAAANEFAAWLRSGPKDAGATTRFALDHLASGKGAAIDGGGEANAYWRGAREVYRRQVGRNDSANGSLMRNGAVPAMMSSWSTEDAVIDAAVRHGITTHFGTIPVLTCVVHAVLIHRALVSQTPPRRAPSVADVEEIIRGPWAAWKSAQGNKDEGCMAWLEEVKLRLGSDERRLVSELSDFESFDPYHQMYRGVSGYAVLTLKVALWALHWALQGRSPSCGIPHWLPSWPFLDSGLTSGGIEAPLRWVALIGADADTYGAVAGALLGAYLPHLPDAWRNALQVREEVAELTAAIPDKW